MLWTNFNVLDGVLGQVEEAQVRW